MPRFATMAVEGQAQRTGHQGPWATHNGAMSFSASVPRRESHQGNCGWPHRLAENPARTACSIAADEVRPHGLGRHGTVVSRDWSTQGEIQHETSHISIVDRPAAWRLAADTSRPQTPDLTIRIHAFIVENYLVAEITAKPRFFRREMDVQLTVAGIAGGIRRQSLALDRKSGSASLRLEGKEVPAGGSLSSRRPSTRKRDNGPSPKRAWIAPSAGVATYRGGHRWRSPRALDGFGNRRRGGEALGTCDRLRTIPAADGDCYPGCRCAGRPCSPDWPREGKGRPEGRRRRLSPTPRDRVVLSGHATAAG